MTETALFLSYGARTATVPLPRYRVLVHTSPVPGGGSFSGCFWCDVNEHCPQAVAALLEPTNPGVHGGAFRHCAVQDDVFLLPDGPVHDDA